MGEWMNGYMQKLAQNHEENRAGGGEDRIALQHELGKLTARERIDYLVDRDSFMELGSLVRDPRAATGELAKPSPSDGVVMGSAQIEVPFGDGKLCAGAGSTGLFRFPVQNSGASGALVEGPGIVAYSLASFPCHK